jgi:hypothetical protein
MMMDKGLDPKAEDGEGKTPLGVATVCGNDDVIGMMDDKEGRPGGEGRHGRGGREQTMKTDG